MIEQLSERNMALESDLSDAQEQIEQLTSLKDTAEELEDSLILAQEESQKQLHAMKVQLLDAKDREQILQEQIKELKQAIVRLMEEQQQQQEEKQQEQQQLQEISKDSANHSGVPSLSSEQPSAPMIARAPKNSSSISIAAKLQQQSIEYHQRKMEYYEQMMPLELIDLDAVEAVLTIDRLRFKARLVQSRCDLVLHDDLASDTERSAALDTARDMARSLLALGTLSAPPPARSALDAIDAQLDSLLGALRADRVADCVPIATRVAALTREHKHVAPSPLAALRDCLDELVYRAQSLVVVGDAKADNTVVELARQLRRSHRNEKVMFISFFLCLKFSTNFV